MSKKVLLVGHCGPDSAFLRMAIHSVDPDAEILAAETDDELAAALDQGVDLLLINRVLDADISAREGVELIRRLRATHPAVPCMLVSNHADAHAAAVAAGAISGFGKRDIGSPAAKSALKAALGIAP
jgi:two-component system, chemotaxis family, chemotaxis protein CheY